MRRITFKDDEAKETEKQKPRKKSDSLIESADPL